MYVIYYSPFKLTLNNHSLVKFVFYGTAHHLRQITIHERKIPKMVTNPKYYDDDIGKSWISLPAMIMLRT
jgi:hypothetical protein